jgi:hypothetical protein
MFKNSYLIFAAAIIYCGATQGMVTLKNGAIENQVTVIQTMAYLRALQKECPLYVSELVRISRDPAVKYLLIPEALKALVKKGFLTKDGYPHASIQNIVVSSAQGAGLFLELADPIAKNTNSKPYLFQV